MNKKMMDQMDVNELMSTVCTIATLKYDGHFTILSFTTNFKGCFGTVTERDEIKQLYPCESLREVLLHMIYPELC
jgi:hypothetical protein